MKKSSSDFIFRLIKSLTKSEKRYFKIYSNRFTYKDKQKYMDLFDAIDKQKEYDEEKLKKYFEGEKFLKHFPTVKTRLKDMVLEALQQMKAQDSEDEKLRKQLRNLEIVYAKKMFKDGFALLSKFEKQLKQEQKWLMLIELNAIKEKYIRQLRLSSAESHRKIVADKNNYLQSLSLQFEIEALYGHLLHLQNQYIFAKNEEMENRVEASQLAITEKIDSITNRKTKIMALEGLCIGDYMLKNWKHMKRNIKTILTIYTDDKKFLKQEMKAYIITSYNYTISCNSSGDFQETLSVVADWQKLQKGKLLSIENSQHLFVYSSVNQLIAYRFIHLSKAIELAYELENTLPLQKINYYIPAFPDVFLEMSYLFFVDDDYSKCIHWAEELHPYSEKYQLTIGRKNIFASIHILLAHFELDNHLYLEHLITQTRRFLKKHQLLDNLHQLIFQYLKKVGGLGAVNPKATMVLWKEFNQKTLTFDFERRRRVLPTLFEEWLESKIQNRPLKDLLIEKNKKENRNSIPYT